MEVNTCKLDEDNVGLKSSLEMRFKAEIWFLELS